MNVCGVRFPGPGHEPHCALLTSFLLVKGDLPKYQRRKAPGLVPEVATFSFLISTSGVMCTLFYFFKNCCNSAPNNDIEAILKFISNVKKLSTNPNRWWHPLLLLAFLYFFCRCCMIESQSAERQWNRSITYKYSVCDRALLKEKCSD